MKRRITNAMRTLTVLLLFAASLFAAGTVTQTIEKLGDADTYAITITWTADAADGTVPTTALLRSGSGVSNTEGFSIVSVVTDPGATAPTANYDVTFVDGRGMDILSDACANRSATATEKCSADPIPIKGTVNFTLSGNSVNSATGTVVVYIVRQTVAKRGGTGGGGSGTVNSGTLNRLAYYGAAGTAISEIPASASQGIATTDSAGAPAVRAVGSGLTVSGAGTPAIDTTIVPQLGAANTFSGANTFSSTHTLTGAVDASGSTTSKPVKTGTTPPATCAVGEGYIDTDAAANTQFLVCEATNVWRSQGTAASTQFYWPFGRPQTALSATTYSAAGTGRCIRFTPVPTVSAVANVVLHVNTAALSATTGTSVAFYDSAGNLISSAFGSEAGFNVANTAEDIPLGAAQTFTAGTLYYSCSASEDTTLVLQAFASTGNLYRMEELLAATSDVFTMTGITWAAGVATWPATTGTRTETLVTHPPVIAFKP